MLYEECIVPTERIGACIKIVSEGDTPQTTEVYGRILSYFLTGTPIRN